MIKFEVSAKKLINLNGSMNCLNKEFLLLRKSNQEEIYMENPNSYSFKTRLILTTSTVSEISLNQTQF